MQYPISILDNDPVFLKLLIEVLKDEFIVNGTTNTNEFVRMIRQPAVLLIDWNLDYGIVGTAVMERVRKENPLTHVIYISNMASKEVLLSVINEGWGCYFIEKDKTDFFTDLIEKIKVAKALLREKLTKAHIQVEKDELLKEQLVKTINAINIGRDT